MAEKRLLILGGTGEARELAARAAALPGLHVISSMAGRTSRPAIPEGELRVGGFGGAAGLAAYLKSAAIDLVVDATHPFAANISHNAAEACDRIGCPHLALVRPPWNPHPNDKWLEVEDMTAAARRLQGLARRVFLTVGRQELASFADLRDCWFLVRIVELLGAPLPLAQAEIVTGRGPFTVADERALLTRHRIDGIVSKNSGGDATYAKIAAARELSLPVVIVRRPNPPPGEQVPSVDEAFAWIAARLA